MLSEDFGEAYPPGGEARWTNVPGIDPNVTHALPPVAPPRGTFIEFVLDLHPGLAIGKWVLAGGLEVRMRA